MQVQGTSKLQKAQSSLELLYNKVCATLIQWFIWFFKITDLITASVFQLQPLISGGIFLIASANIGCDCIITGDITTTALVIYCIGDLWLFQNVWNRLS